MCKLSQTSYMKHVCKLAQTSEIKLVNVIVKRCTYEFIFWRVLLSSFWVLEYFLYVIINWSVAIIEYTKESGFILSDIYSRDSDEQLWISCSSQNAKGFYKKRTNWSFNNWQFVLVRHGTWVEEIFPIHFLFRWKKKKV